MGGFVMSSRSVIFAEPVRTAIGTFGGSLKDVSAPALGATAIGAAVARAAIRSDEVETVVMGNVVQAGTKMNPARQAAVHAGLPVTTPAMTVNRVCGSGAQAIVSAAQEIALGNIEVAVAGGMENMDLAPYLVTRARWGYRMGDGQLYDSVLRDGLNDAFSDAHSGWHTEDLIEKYQVTRDAQDRWALRSQERFANAQAQPVISRRRSCPSKCLAKRDRRNSTGTNTTGPTRRSRLSLGSSLHFGPTARSLRATPRD
jgi:acetyl-CoA C-acetyltransferase